MKLTIITAIAVALLSACAANPSPAPEVAVPAAASPNSCVARHDQTPCTLTNQEAFIEILEMSRTNVEIQCWKTPATWQQMMQPPVPTGECR